MTTSPRLGITQLEESQALPEAVVNEGVLYLEMFATRLIVKSQGDTAPPGSPADGDAYLIGTSATGAWNGHDDALALYVNGAWVFITPKEGFEIEVEDEDTAYVLRGGTWVDQASGVGIDVEDEGASEATGATTLNFTGAGVTATDAGGGVVDIDIPGGSAASFALISEQSPSGTGTVTFSSISAAYRDLMVVVRGRGTTAATSVGLVIRLNNDSGSNYDRQRVRGVNATADASAQTATDSLFGNALGLPAASATADVAGSVEVKIYDYRGTTFQKAAEARIPFKTGTTAADLSVQLLAGFWRSTAAVNRVDVILSAGNFVAGSVVSLYGVM